MIRIRNSDQRGHANHGWLDSRFTFSFADYYDPEFVEYRTLRVMNDDHIAGGGGFPTRTAWATAQRSVRATCSI